MDKEVCENCKYYNSIDSGYGYCRRFPPKDVWWSGIFRRKFKSIYPVVAWCDKVCGEFKIENL